MEITEKTKKFLTRLKAAMKETDEPVLYEAGNLPYHSTGDESSYEETYNYAKNVYGELGEICFFLARMDSQVCNGGFTQWYDNGYLTSSGGGVFRNRRNEENDFLERFIELFENSDFFELPNGKEVYQILIEFSEELDAVKEECYKCHNKRYLPCENCHGTGKTDGGEDECDLCDGEGTLEEGEECPNCHGSGEVNTDEEDCAECEGEGTMPCEDCNDDGQLEENAPEGELNHTYINVLDSKYYNVNDAFIKEVDNYLNNLMEQYAGAGFLATAASFKEAKKRPLKEDDYYPSKKSWSVPTHPFAADSWELFARIIAENFMKDKDEFWFVDVIEAFKPDEDGTYFVRLSDDSGKSNATVYTDDSGNIIRSGSLSSHKNSTIVYTDPEYAEILKRKEEMKNSGLRESYKIKESSEDKEEKLKKLLEVPFVKEELSKGPIKYGPYSYETVDEMIDHFMRDDADFALAGITEMLGCKAKEGISEFNKKLVPNSGKCDTLAGELYRAAMKLNYRFYNDGDGPGNDSTYEAFNFLFRKVRLVNEIFIREFNEDFPANQYGEYSMIEFFKKYGHVRMAYSSIKKEYEMDLEELFGDISLIAFILETLKINPRNSEDMLDCTDGPLEAPTGDDYTYKGNEEDFIE